MNYFQKKKITSKEKKDVTEDKCAEKLKEQFRALEREGDPFETYSEAF